MTAPDVKPLLCNKHVSVDGTLLQTWASHASLKRIVGEENPQPPPSGLGRGFEAPKEGKNKPRVISWHQARIKLSNKTHCSSTDPDALLARNANAHPAQQNYNGHVLMDNHHALIVDCKVRQAKGTDKRDAKAMGCKSSRCPPKDHRCRQEPRHQGLCRLDGPHRLHNARGPEFRAPRWIHHRWANHTPRGLRQIDH